ITKSAEAAQKAMAGLEDTLGKLSNTLGKIGQAFGTGLLQPLEVVAQSVNKIMTPFSKFMDLLGAVPGLMAAVSAVAMLRGGPLICSIGGMLGLAGAAQLGRSAHVAGWAAGRRGQSELGFRSMPAWQQIIAKDVQSQAAQRNLGIPRENVVGRAGLWQRMLFSTGYGLGQAIPG